MKFNGKFIKMVVFTKEIQELFNEKLAEPSSAIIKQLIEDDMQQASTYLDLKYRTASYLYIWGIIKDMSIQTIYSSMTEEN
jgi:hypothetical protein